MAMGDFFIEPKTLLSLLSTQGAPAVLDVRKRPAYEEDGRMIPNATWRDPAEVAAWSNELDAGRRYVVHCVHGHEVSQGAATYLRDRGFDAQCLAGGMEGWREAGGPVIATPPKQTS